MFATELGAVQILQYNTVTMLTFMLFSYDHLYAMNDNRKPTLMCGTAN